MFSYEDACKYLKGVLETQFPNLTFADDAALNDLLIKPAAYIMYQTLALAEQAASLFFLNEVNIYKDPFVLDEAASNFFIFRRYGKPATGEVTIYFTNPDNVIIRKGATISTLDGKIYSILNEIRLTATQLATYERDGFYPVKVPVVSINTGAIYNLPANTPFVVLGGITGPVLRIVNEQDISGGVDQELSADFLRRIFQELPTVPSGATKGGLMRYLFEQFGNYILDMDIIGAGHPLMFRDLIPTDCQECLGFCGKISGSDIPNHNYIYTSLELYSFRVKYDSLYSNEIEYTYNSDSAFSIEDPYASFNTGENPVGVGDIIFLGVKSGLDYVLYGPYIIENVEDTTLSCRKIEQNSPPDGSLIQRFWVLGRNKNILPEPDYINTGNEISTIDYTRWCKHDSFLHQQNNFLLLYLADDIVSTEEPSGVPGSITDYTLEDTWNIKQLDESGPPIFGVITTPERYLAFGRAIIDHARVLRIGSRYPVAYKYIGFQKDINILASFSVDEKNDQDSWAFILVRHDPTKCATYADLNGLGVAFKKTADSPLLVPISGECTLENGMLIDPDADFVSEHIIPGIPIYITQDDTTEMYYVLAINDSTSLYLGDIGLSGSATYSIKTNVPTCANVVINEISEEGHRYITPSQASGQFAIKKYGGVLDSIFETELFHTLSYGRYYIATGQKYNMLIEITEYNAIAVKIWPDNEQISCPEAIEKIPWVCISPPYIDPVVDGYYFLIGIWNGVESIWRFYDNLKIWPRDQARPYSILKFFVGSGSGINISNPARVQYAGYILRGDTCYSPAFYIWNETIKEWQIIQPESPLLNCMSDDVEFYFESLTDYVKDDYVYIGVTTDPFVFGLDYGCKNEYSDGIYHDFAALCSISRQLHSWGAVDIYLFTNILRTTTTATIESDNVVRLGDNFNHPIVRIIAVRERATQVPVDYVLSILDHEMRYSTAESLALVISDFPPGTVLEIEYEYFTNIQDIQNAIDTDLAMFPHQDILVFHFIPVFVNINLTYTNGPLVDDLVTLLKNFINCKKELSIYELKTRLLMYGLSLKDVDKLTLTFYEHNKTGAIRTIFNEYHCDTIHRLIFDPDSVIQMQ